MPAATIDQVSRACNLTPQRVQQLVKQGILPRNGRGEYNIGQVLMAYVRYLQQSLSAKGSMDDDGEISSTRHQRAQLLAVQTEREKIELARSRGEIMSVADHQAFLSKLIIETKARVKAIAPRVAPEIVGESNRLMVQAKIDKAVDEALSNLAKLSTDTPSSPASPPTRASKKKAKTPRP